jgi:hypothetical protein
VSTFYRRVIAVKIGVCTVMDTPIANFLIVDLMSYGWKLFLTQAWQSTWTELIGCGNFGP